MTDTDFTFFDSLAADEILAIDAAEPERLFTNDAALLAKAYRYLARRWHPDFCADAKAPDVFTHLTSLYEKARAKLADGTWETPGLCLFAGLDGKTRQLRYAQKYTFELGMGYIARSVVAYSLPRANQDLFDSAVKHIRSLSFADAAMKTACERYVPQIVESFQTKDAAVLVLKKDPELLRLRDVLDHFGGRMDPKQAAWILSSLHHLSCYLAWSGLTHNALGVDDYFIAPTAHTGTLLGGWWYAAREGAPLVALPARSFDVAPPDLLRTQIASGRLDLSLIRATGRTLLGDPTGFDLARRTDVPSALATWLCLPTTGKAQEDYKAWIADVLPASYGPRRYVPMPLTFEDLYSKKGGINRTHSKTASSRRASPAP